MDYPKEYLVSTAKQFRLEGRVLDVRLYGSGRINDTYIVAIESDREEKVILQRINNHVFQHPDRIMSNMRFVLDHINKRIAYERQSNPRITWKVPGIFPTHDGKDYFLDDKGSFWRVFSFISAFAGDTITGISHAKEIGFGIGRFHDLLSNLATEKLYDILEGFHITPLYIQTYEKTIMSRRLSEDSDEIHYCMDFIRDRREWASVLEHAKKAGLLLVRPIHGDPKSENIMIDDKTGKAIGVIDMDTVMPGLVHYDIGDCLRSCCNTSNEEGSRLGEVSFRIDYCRAVLEGYINSAGSFLTDNDFRFMYDAIRLIPFELGLRFFTDYLKGNIYFKVNKPDDNLKRALVQFRLTESIEQQADEIRLIISDLR
ncbi:MAG: aminoglycoside phosphotransferase family protein [Nitrospiraceae bacterium]|nr:MAG: aminoglycoside phosphotransferase family protein [Nitrospiraceae bacterium]